MSGRRRVGVRVSAVAALIAVTLTVIGVPAGTAGSYLPPTNRYVALGDSVPYGHGLANPYRTGQIGLPAISQGPSVDAYPSLVANALGLSMSVRPSNCGLTGDQLAISGAMAANANDHSGEGQCPNPPTGTNPPIGRNVQTDELTAAMLATNPAKLVTIQAGADDFDFGGCLEWALTQQLGVGLGFGTQCVQNGAVTKTVASQLTLVTTALTRIIELAARDARHVAVVNYYQPVPSPSQFAASSVLSGLNVNIVCLGLAENGSSTYATAQVVQNALNQAIAKAVLDADVSNVSLVDISNVGSGQGMCTANPVFFSGEPMPAVQLGVDLTSILAAQTCPAIVGLLGPTSCAGISTGAVGAEQDIKNYVWRAAHPTASGQQEIANAVEAQLCSEIAECPPTSGAR